MKQCNVTVAGLAHVHAAVYLEALRGCPQAQLAGVWDFDATLGQAVARQFETRCFGSLDEALSAAELVVVCSENTRHAPIVLAAAQKGVPVLCEKPLGTSLVEMRQMIVACEAGGGGLMTAFPNRFLDSVNRVREAIRAGSLGDILSVKATNRGKMPGGFFIQPALSGGGSLIDHVVHVTDLLNWFFDEVPEWAFAFADTRFYPELTVEDAAMVQMRYPCGAMVTLDASWSLCEKNPGARDLTMDIVGTKGSLRLDIVEGHNTVLSAKSDRRAYFDLGPDKSRRMIDAAVACVRAGEPFPITGEDGYRASAVALAALQSLGGDTPVPVAL